MQTIRILYQNQPMEATENDEIHKIGAKNLAALGRPAAVRADWAARMPAGVPHQSAAGCRIQTTASASRRALLTGRVSSQAQRAPAKQRTDSKSIQPISLNQATQAELENLPGIGEQKAQAILAYRDAHGRFRTYEELLEVEGIGEATLERLLPYLTLE